MCLMCGDATLAHAFSISGRPRHRLTGRNCSGSHDAAAKGALHPLIEEMKALSARTSDLWKSPIVGLTWNDRADGFSYFVGIETTDNLSGQGFDSFDVPEMQCAGIWHGPDMGSVVETYGAMIGWLTQAGIARDTSFCDQREEYANTVDLSARPALRLMLPVKPSSLPSQE